MTHSEALTQDFSFQNWSLSSLSLSISLFVSLSLSHSPSVLCSLPGWVLHEPRHPDVPGVPVQLGDEDVGSVHLHRLSDRYHHLGPRQLR